MKRLKDQGPMFISIALIIVGAFILTYSVAEAFG